MSKLTEGLFDAVKRNNVGAVEKVLKRGANVNAQDNCYMTALHHAAWNGHASIVTILLENGAQVNIKNAYGDIALHFAAQRGYDDITKILSDYESDVNHLNEDGCSPLHLACEKIRFTRGNKHCAVVKILLETKGIDINKLTNNDDNPVSALSIAVKYGHVNLVEILLDKVGSNVIYNEAKDITSPLEWAIIQRNEAIKYKTIEHDKAVEDYETILTLLLKNIFLAKPNPKKSSYALVTPDVKKSDFVSECAFTSCLWDSVKKSRYSLLSKLRSCTMFTKNGKVALDPDSQQQIFESLPNGAIENLYRAAVFP